jgi:hypothetical protein
MSGRLGSFSLPNLSLFIVKVLAGEYRKDRRCLNNEVISAVSGVEIRFTGWQLNQEDLDVCAQLFHVARVHPLGIICEFAAHGFLKAIGRNTGSKSYEDLDQSITRL